MVNCNMCENTRSLGPNLGCLCNDMKFIKISALMADFPLYEFEFAPKDEAYKSTFTYYYMMHGFKKSNPMYIPPTIE